MSKFQISGAPPPEKIQQAQVKPTIVPAVKPATSIGIRLPTQQAATAVAPAPIQSIAFTGADLLGPATVEQFQKNVKLLHQSFEGRQEMIAPVMRRILIDLQEHEEFREFMMPEDWGSMMRMMRDSYGMIVAKKKKNQKKKEPKAPSVDMEFLKEFTFEM